MLQDAASKQTGAAHPTGDDVRAFLENLTGPSRGRITWLSSDQLRAGIDADRALWTSPVASANSQPTPLADLSWTGDTYEIEALSGEDIWVNGRKIGVAQLLHGDMIEFGEDGPMSRFRLVQNKFPTRWPIEEILGDTFSYARNSRRPFRSRLSNALFDGLRRIVWETSAIFRVTVILVLIVLTTLVAFQYRDDQRLQDSITQEAQRLEALATTLAETRQDALTASEFTTLREQLDLQLSTNADRLALLERRLGASARVISASTASVGFLQGAYGLRQAESGKLMRHVLGADGQPLRTPLGKPVVDVDGDGAPVEFQFTGTGFLLKNGGHLITNRHVALPWTIGDRMLAFEQSGFAPEMLKLLAYFPGMTSPVEAVFVKASETADLALLSVSDAATAGRGLSLADGVPQIGDEVIVIGFATGLRALLAQAGREFLTMLEQQDETDFWTIASRLSEQDRIAPLASRGIIAQITNKAVIYDAETTVGGSGGPALDNDGNVIAVNSAILPEFGGANIGVPVQEVQRLLQATDGN